MLINEAQWTEWGPYGPFRYGISLQVGNTDEPGKESRSKGVVYHMINALVNNCLSISEGLSMGANECKALKLIFSSPEAQSVFRFKALGRFDR
jgi:hypothetical protein